MNLIANCTPEKLLNYDEYFLNLLRVHNNLDIYLNKKETEQNITYQIIIQQFAIKNYLLTNAPPVANKNNPSKFFI